MDPRCTDVITLAKAADNPNIMQFLLKILERHSSWDKAEDYRELRLLMEKNYNLMDLDSRLKNESQ